MRLHARTCLAAVLSLLGACKSRTFHADAEQAPGTTVWDAGAPLVAEIRLPLSEVYEADVRRVADEGQWEPRRNARDGRTFPQVRFELRDASGVLMHAGDVGVELIGRDSLALCAMPKMKLSFPDKNNPFGEKKVRLLTHCNEDDATLRTGRRPPHAFFYTEISVLREHFVHQVGQILGFPMQRTRPVRVRYVDAANPAKSVERVAIFQERVEDAAERFGDDEYETHAKAHPDTKACAAPDNGLRVSSPDALAQESLVRMFLFEALLLNDDWEICNLHGPQMGTVVGETGSISNVEIFRNPADRSWVPVPRDFGLAYFTLFLAKAPNPDWSEVAAVAGVQMDAHFSEFRHQLNGSRWALTSDAQRAAFRLFQSREEELRKAAELLPAADEHGRKYWGVLLDRFFAALKTWL